MFFDYQKTIQTASDFGFNWPIHRSNKNWGLKLFSSLPDFKDCWHSKLAFYTVFNITTIHKSIFSHTFIWCFRCLLFVIGIGQGSSMTNYIFWSGMNKTKWHCRSSAKTAFGSLCLLINSKKGFSYKIYNILKTIDNKNKITKSFRIIYEIFLKSNYFYMWYAFLLLSFLHETVSSPESMTSNSVHKTKKAKIGR